MFCVLWICLDFYVFSAQFGSIYTKIRFSWFNFNVIRVLENVSFQVVFSNALEFSGVCCLLNWVCFPFCLVSFVKNLSILLIFSKNQLHDSGIFILFFYPMFHSFCSLLFLSLYWSWVVVILPCCRILRWISSELFIFLIQALIPIIFSLRNAFIVTHTYC